MKALGYSQARMNQIYSTTYLPINLIRCGHSDEQKKEWCGKYEWTSNTSKDFEKITTVEPQFTGDVGQHNFVP